MRGGLPVIEHRVCVFRVARAVWIVCAVCFVCLLSGCWGDDEDSADGSGGACHAMKMVQRRAGTRISGPVDAVYFLAAYNIQDNGTISAPDGGPCAGNIAARLTEACGRCSEDSAACEPLVRAIFATPSPACTTCGDNVCLTGEDASTCAVDCADNCGDGICASVESAVDCPVDCAVACGDGLCTDGETPTTCPIDCEYTVGDGLCQAGENAINSPVDCAFWTCGDSYCQSYEDAERCPADCCESALRCQAGTFCMSWNKVGRCVARGEGGCSQRVEDEVCAFGCVQSAEIVTDGGACLDGCTDAHCKTCEEIITELGLGEFCSLGQYAPRCEPAGQGAAHWTCEPLHGFTGCGVVRKTFCSVPPNSGDLVRAICDPTQGCFICDERVSCTANGGLIGAQRCAGTKAEVCASVAGCNVWQVLQDCGEGGACEQPNPGGAASCVVP